MTQTNLRAVFCDFDGTVTKKDVGYSLFHHFSNGKNDALLPDWKSGRMSTRECLRREAAMVHASEKEIMSFLDQFEIDNSFRAFVTECESAGVTVVILSDGLDFYIDYILKKNELSFLTVSANRGRIQNDGITVEFPNVDQDCKRCGSCKREFIQAYQTQSNGDGSIAFVGDGYSDLCAVQAVDLLFAKKDLARYCREHDFDYYTYNTFADVTTTLRRLGMLTN